MGKRATTVSHFVTHHPRFLSGLWFAVAAAVCVLIALSVLPLVLNWNVAQAGVDDFIFYVIVPILAAGLLGSLQRPGIVRLAQRPNFSASQSQKRAVMLEVVLRGMAVGFQSFLIFAFCLSLMSLLNSLATADGTQSISNFAGLFLMVIFFGLLFSGWVIALVSGLAAWGLWKFSQRYTANAAASLAQQ
jgi:hypothetical protein